MSSPQEEQWFHSLATALTMESSGSPASSPKAPTAPPRPPLFSPMIPRSARKHSAKTTPPIGAVETTKNNVALLPLALTPTALPLSSSTAAAAAAAAAAVLNTTATHLQPPAIFAPPTTTTRAFNSDAFTAAPTIATTTTTITAATRTKGPKQSKKANPFFKARGKRAGRGSHMKSRDSHRRHVPSKISIVSDSFPTRITNPLLEELPGDHHSTVYGAELYKSTDLVYMNPDTFPVSYMARLLGFDVPPPDPGSKIPFPTPLPKIDSLSLRDTQNDVALQIPDQQLHGTSFRRQNRPLGSDPDDRCLLDYVDPVYSHLLRYGFITSQLKAAPANLVSKFSNKQKIVDIQPVVKVAQSILDLDQKWSFSYWTSGKESPRWTIDGSTCSVNPHTFGIVASYNKEARVMLQYHFHWYTMSKADNLEAELVMTVQGIGQLAPAETERTTPSNSTTAETVQPPNSAATASIEASTISLQSENDFAAPKTATLPPSTPPSKPTSLGRTAVPISTLIENDDTVLLVMFALALEHTRACDVWYSLFKKSFGGMIKDCFRMSPLPKSGLVCDLKKCSSKYAFLKRHEMIQQIKSIQQEEDSTTDQYNERWLVRLPNVEDATACFDPKAMELHQHRSSSRAMSQRTSVSTISSMESSIPSTSSFGNSSRIFTGASGHLQEASVQLRAICGSEKDSYAIQLFTRHNSEGETKDDGAETAPMLQKLTLPPQTDIDSTMEILRCFPVHEQTVLNSTTPTTTAIMNDEEQNEILSQLKFKQQQLMSAEKKLEPNLRELLSKIIQERWEYETPENRQKVDRDKRILKEYEEEVARRKEIDQRWQDQLEEDMNAVCNICSSGEVTPDNQILFCEACNVPVHQMCYGIEEVPEGDYYCVACRYFKRDEMIAKNNRKNAPRIPCPMLPISCELCPIKQGAYIRTAPPLSPASAITCTTIPAKTSSTKWVHMACAKWQGLNFEENNNPEVVEDVSTLKIHFRRLDIACYLCKGKRGAYHKCLKEGCQRWMHVNCARVSGLCEVNYGEDVEGEPTEDPWTLMCPEHSELDQTLDDISTSAPLNNKKTMSLEQLKRAAKEFPDEPMPEPLPPPNRVFNKLNGKERAKALANLEYEKEFLRELSTKKFAGGRCEVCNMEDSGTQLQRCSTCWAICCMSCRLSRDDSTLDQKYFTCFACQYVKVKDKSKHQSKPEDKTKNEIEQKVGTEDEEKKSEGFEIPQCHVCPQKGGLLLESFAKPVGKGKKAAIKSKAKEFKNTLWGKKKLWTHYSCAFWSQHLHVNAVKCIVDSSSVIMSHGRGHVNGRIQCGLCGLRTGLKTNCLDPSCRARGERSKPYHFHITCARQAGYEVNHDDDNPVESQFYVYCYDHGGNEYNLRARLEDLIEVERRRSGKRFGKADQPMNFNDASRLLNCSMLCLRILGWAWRWAEFWVEKNSTWEPLLEPGQKEENMTRAQLKIVESSPISRCQDARRCRLAAFGAALRNRNYDEEDDKFDNDSLSRALRAVLNTKSLVGPWKDFEIDFLIDWLARAYRSKNRLLGLGDDKIPVASDGFCAHIDGNSPKFELGNRPLPGKAPLKNDEVFEMPVDEPDDFLKAETLADGSLYVPPEVPEEKKQQQKKKLPKAALMPVESKKETPKKRGQGRPRSVERNEPPRSAQTKKSTSRVSASSPYAGSAAVAALAPSAIKRRVSLKFKSFPPKPSPKRNGSSAGLEAEVAYQDLNAGGLLLSRKGRGRPPRLLRLSVIVHIGDEDFITDSIDGEGTQAKDAVDSSITNRESGDDSEDSKTEKTTARHSPRKLVIKTKNYAENSDDSEIDEIVVSRRNHPPAKKKPRIPNRDLQIEIENENEADEIRKRRSGRPSRKPHIDDDVDDDERDEESTESKQKPGRRTERKVEQNSIVFDSIFPGKKRARSAKSSSTKAGRIKKELGENNNTRRKNNDVGRRRPGYKGKNVLIEGDEDDFSGDEDETGYGTDASIPLSTLYPPSKKKKQRTDQGFQSRRNFLPRTEVILQKPGRLKGKIEAASTVLIFNKSTSIIESL